MPYNRQSKFSDGPLHPRGLGYKQEESSHGEANPAIGQRYTLPREYKTDRPLSRPVAFVKGRAQPLMKVDPVEEHVQQPVAPLDPIDLVVQPTLSPDSVHDSSDEDCIVYVPPKASTSQAPSISPEIAIAPIQTLVEPVVTTVQTVPEAADVTPTKGRHAKANAKRNAKRASRKGRKQSLPSQQQSNSQSLNRSDLDDGDASDQPDRDFIVPSNAAHPYINGKEAKSSKKSAQSQAEMDALADYLENAMAQQDSEEEQALEHAMDEFDGMTAFLRGARAISGSAAQHQTIDDLDDEEKLRAESGDDLWQTESELDSEGEKQVAVDAEVTASGSGSDEVELVEDIIREETLLLVAGGNESSSEDDSESDSESEEDEIQPKQWISDGSEDDSDDGTPYTKPMSRKRKIYQAIEQGDFTLFDDDDELFALSSRPKGKGKNRSRPQLTEDDHFMAELQAQWTRDQERKAERKRSRLEARMKKQPTKKEIKKARKMGLEVQPKNKVDLLEVHASLQSFLMAPDQTYLTLPPMDKKDRVAVHLLAECYYLKSQSKGSGPRRFPTIHRTAHSTLYGVDEGKIQSILRASQGDYRMPIEKGQNKRKGRMNALLRELNDPGSSRLGKVAKNRDGDIVGSGAAELQNDNVGFRLLAKMGWSEGERMGLAGGIHVPIAARIKTTRSGLGH